MGIVPLKKKKIGVKKIENLTEPKMSLDTRRIFCQRIEEDSYTFVASLFLEKLDPASCIYLTFSNENSSPE